MPKTKVVFNYPVILMIFSASNFSTLISVLAHTLIVLIFVIFSTQRNNFHPQQFTEVQLGGGNGLAYTGGNNKNQAAETPKRKDVIFENKNKKNITSTQPIEAGEKEGTGEGDGTGDGTGTGDGIGIPLNIPDPNQQKILKPESNIYLVAVDEMPEPFGGMQSVYSKVVYPLDAKANGISGTVYVLAFIDESGNVRRTLLAKGIGGGCDEAAVTAVKKTKFKPGRHKGENVKVQMHIAITFK
jgi:TonB family protein